MEQTLQVFLSQYFCITTDINEIQYAYARSLMAANTVLYAEHLL